MQIMTGTFGLSLNTLIQVTVSAINNKGSGPASATLTTGALVRTVPTLMSNPVRGSSTNEQQIQVTWANITGIETGESPVTAYDLWWDNGLGTPDYDLTSGLINSYTVTGLVADSNYIFTVRAKNIYGYGPFSSSITIRTSTVPHAMSPITTTQNGTSIIVTWTAPLDGGEVIDGYEI